MLSYPFSTSSSKAGPLSPEIYSPAVLQYAAISRALIHVLWDRCTGISPSPTRDFPGLCVSALSYGHVRQKLYLNSRPGVTGCILTDFLISLNGLLGLLVLCTC